MDQNTADILKKYNYNPAAYAVNGATAKPAVTGADRIAELDNLANQTVPEKKNFIQKVASATGMENFGKGIAAAVGNMLGYQDMVLESNQQIMDAQTKLLKLRKDKVAKGEDVTKIDTILKDMEGQLKKGADTAMTVGTNDVSNRQVLASAGMTLLNVLSAGQGVEAGALKGVPAAEKVANVLDKGMKATIASGASKTIKAPSTVVQGLKTGFIQGAKSGGTVGTIGGALMALQKEGDTNAMEVLSQAAISGLSSALLGGVIGGLLGGVSGKINSNKLKKDALGGFSVNETQHTNALPDVGDIHDAQVKAGLKPDLDMTKLTKKQQKLFDLARTQGLEDKDIKFLASMSPDDRAVAADMIKLADKANDNLRVTERPIDMAGRTMVDKLKLVASNQSKAGKLVDQAAKSLKGAAVDVTPLREQIIQKLDDAGIAIGEGDKLDFSNSVFKNVPEVQKEIQKVITTVPDGSDAYQLHIFKKSIDELVDYGTKGEGLKGNAKNILKAFRSYADDVLDKNFDNYNQANIEFKMAKDLSEYAEDLFGKKISPTGKGADIRAGQILRSAFSNNASRGRVFDLAEQLDNYEKLYTGKVGKNALDQALFAEVLDKSGLYDTQAITGLAGQVETAINKTKAVAEGIANPLKGVANAVKYGIEKAQNISPEQKRKVLEALLK